MSPFSQLFARIHMNLIPKTIAKFDDYINDCGPWVDNFKTLIFRPSFLYKGPFLAITKENADAIVLYLHLPSFHRFI